jgi:hypothetical protein
LPVAVDRRTIAVLTAIVVHVNNVGKGRDGNSRLPRLFATCSPAKESGIMPIKQHGLRHGRICNEP